MQHHYLATDRLKIIKSVCHLALTLFHKLHWKAMLHQSQKPQTQTKSCIGLHSKENNRTSRDSQRNHHPLLHFTLIRKSWHLTLMRHIMKLRIEFKFLVIKKILTKKVENKAWATILSKEKARKVAAWKILAIEGRLLRVSMMININLLT